MLHGLARGAVQLGMLRVLLGLGEAGNFMAAFKAISEWYPPKERAFVNGLVQAGASAGADLAPPVVTLLMHWYGWRWAFVATGSLGFSGWSRGSTLTMRRRNTRACPIVSANSY